MHNKFRTRWTKRLAALVNRDPYQKAEPNTGSMSRDMTLTFTDDAGREYDLEVTVFAEYEPAQNGGMTDPSWDAYCYNPTAWYYRAGRGWKKMPLTDCQEQSICEELAEGCGDDGYDCDDRDDDRDYFYD